MSSPATLPPVECMGGTGLDTLPVLTTPESRIARDFPSLKNDHILRAAKGLTTTRTPIWCHRQAGRYLPEFKATRKLGDFFTMCRTPELAAELTLQPIRRYDFDAAIIFSDILVVPQALGLEVLMKEGVGPVLPQPLKTPDDMSRLKKPDEIDVNRDLGYVFQAITLTRHSLQGTVPLIGFCGAPWTLMAYMIEGGGSKSYTLARSWLYKHPEESKQLLKRINDVLVDYLIGQVRAGAQLLEVFDTWSSELSSAAFKEFILPILTDLAHRVKKGLKEQGLEVVPITLFPKGSDYCLEWIADLTEYDTISLDWNTDVQFARSAVKGKLTLQGNLDPAVLYASESQLRQEVRNMLAAFGPQRYIANRGHGMLPDHPPLALKWFIEEIHNYSQELNKKQ